MVKMQSANVVSIIGRGVETLDNFDAAAAFFSALGREHQGRNVKKEHFIFIEDGFVETLKQLTGIHFDPIVRKAWVSMFWVIQEKMLKMEKYDHKTDFLFLSDLLNRNKSAVMRDYLLRKNSFTNAKHDRSE